MISPTSATLGQARGAVVVTLAGFAAGSWMYLGVVAARMGDMSSVLAMPMTSAWSPVQAALMVTMWAAMMAAMMVPSAVPMVLTYDRLHRGWPDGQGGSATLFVAGYAIVWSAFAVVAAGLQWVLQTVALVDGIGRSDSERAGGFAVGRRRSLPVLAG